jgi:hypothetical protein
MTVQLDPRRVVGVDVARCLALLGMMATHILPGFVEGEVTVAQQVAGGRASALFAVLAGTSLVLVAGSRSPIRGRAWQGMLAGTLVRATLIGLIGLLLGHLETGIAVILVYYAVLFVVAIPFLALGTRTLVAVTAAWILVAPVVSHLWRQSLPGPSYQVPSFDSFEAPLTLLRELVVTGYYPVLTWVSYVLVGILVGRLDLRSWRSAGWLVAVGAWGMVLAWAVSDALVGRPGVRAELIASYTGLAWKGDLDATLTNGLYGVTPTGSPWWLAVRAPHSGTTFDLLMTIGSACLVLGVCLVLGRLLPRLSAVVFGAGALTLSLYTLHVVLRTEGWWDGDDLATYLGQAALVLTIGAAFRVAGRRGPLEFLVGEASGGVRSVVTRRR